MKKTSSKTDPKTTTIPTPARTVYWPETVPTLIAADLAHWGRETKDRHSLSLWFDLVFTPELCGRTIRNKAYNELLAVVFRVTGYNGLQAPDALLDDLAASWNIAMRELGYEVSEHLCTVLGTKRKKKDTS